MFNFDFFFLLLIVFKEVIETISITFQLEVKDNALFLNHVLLLKKRVGYC